MPVHHGVTPSIEVAGTYLHTWVERGTVRVKCPAQEHNARTRTAQSGAEQTNQEETFSFMEEKKNSSLYSVELDEIGIYQLYSF